MTFYRWAMRNGSGILFVMSLLAFFVSFFSQFVMKWSSVAGSTLSMENGEGPSRLWFLIASLIQAISSSATIFAAACIVYWLERRSGVKDSSK